MAKRRDTTNTSTRKCSVEGCEHTHSAKGYCAKHYQSTRSDRVAEACSVEGCSHSVYAKQLCSIHYQRNRKRGDPNIVLGRPNVGRSCEVSGCGNPAATRLLCSAHYQIKKKYGDPENRRGIPWGDARRWLLAHVECQTAECLIWPYSRNSRGYGQISWVTNGKKRPRVASNLICELAHGPAPFAKAEAAHECGNGHLGCVNPGHLSWKTHKANIADAVRHGRMGRKRRD